MLTAETEATVLARALQAGADAVLGKTMPFPNLIREIMAIPRGQLSEAANRYHQVMYEARVAEQERARRLAPFVALTPREEEVLSMLVDGVRADDIAEAAFVSLSTVRSQIRSVLAKLGVGSQLAAVRWRSRRSGRRGRTDVARRDGDSVRAIADPPRQGDHGRLQSRAWSGGCWLRRVESPVLGMRGSSGEQYHS